MATEHDLTRKVTKEIRERELRGEPIYARKIHGNVYQRNMLDWTGCYAGLAFYIETKPPERLSYDLTPGQSLEKRRIEKAKGEVAVCRTIQEVREFLDALAIKARHFGLTE